MALGPASKDLGGAGIALDASAGLPDGGRGELIVASGDGAMVQVAVGDLTAGWRWPGVLAGALAGLAGSAAFLANDLLPVQRGLYVASQLTLILLGVSASIILVCMMGLTFVDVVARYLFNYPLRGAFEVPR